MPEKIGLLKKIDRIIGLGNVVGSITLRGRLQWKCYLIERSLPNKADLFLLYVKMYVSWCKLRLIHAHLTHPNYTLWKIRSIIIARRNKIEN